MAQPILQTLVKDASGLVLVGADADGRATSWWSTDGGVSWTTSPIGALDARSPVVVGGSSSTVAAVLASPVDPSQTLATSLDGGATWDLTPFAEHPTLAPLGPLRVDAITVTEDGLALAAAPTDATGQTGPVEVLHIPLG